MANLIRYKCTAAHKATETGVDYYDAFLHPLPLKDQPHPELFQGHEGGRLGFARLASPLFVMDKFYEFTFAEVATPVEPAPAPAADAKPAADAAPADTAKKPAKTK